MVVVILLLRYPLSDSQVAVGLKLGTPLGAVLSEGGMDGDRLGVTVGLKLGSLLELGLRLEVGLKLGTSDGTILAMHV